MIKEKHPLSIIPVTWDFAAEIPAGDALTSASHVLIYNQAGEEVTEHMLVATDVVGTKINALIEGGVNREHYIIRFIGAGESFQFVHDVVLKVRMETIPEAPAEPLTEVDEGEE